MTNILMCLVVTSLVTNYSIEWPKLTIADPCPEGRIGCAVFHSHKVDDTNSLSRLRVTTVSRITSLVAPELKVNLVVWSNTVSRSSMLQTASTVWTDSGDTNAVLDELHLDGLRFNSTGIVWHTNLLETNVVWLGPQSTQMTNSIPQN